VEGSVIAELAVAVAMGGGAPEILVVQVTAFVIFQDAPFAVVQESVTAGFDALAAGVVCVAVGLFVVRNQTVPGVISIVVAMIVFGQIADRVECQILTVVREQPVLKVKGASDRSTGDVPDAIEAILAGIVR